MISKLTFITLCASTIILFLITLPSFTLNHTVVTKIKDGDTIIVSSITKETTCRLYGIDAPEITQVYGKEAKEHLAKLILNKSVTIETNDKKTYNRDVCNIYLNGKDINLQMVKDGYAWAYVEYLKRPHASKYLEAEKEARQNKNGLWKQNNPQPPWEYRQNKKRRYFNDYKR